MHLAAVHIQTSRPASSPAPGTTAIRAHMSIEPGSPPPLLGTVVYLAEVAKDWAEHRFASAKRCAECGSVAYEEEIVEVLVVEGDDLHVEAAFVARMPGFPPCLGRFRPVS